MARQSSLPFPVLISAFWFSTQTIKIPAQSSEGSNLEEEPTFPASTPNPGHLDLREDSGQWVQSSQISGMHVSFVGSGQDRH